MPRLADVRVQHAHAGDEHRHLRAVSVSSCALIEQQRLRRHAVLLPDVTEPVGDGPSGRNDGRPVCSADASMPRWNSTVTSTPAAFAAARSPHSHRARSDPQRDLRKPDALFVELRLDASSAFSTARAGSRPSSARDEARAVRPASLVRSAERPCRRYAVETSCERRVPTQIFALSAATSLSSIS